ncbi:MAG: phage holin family protein [Clostridia bacterium]|nr:phage holin family protein [Clostridia bacterium]
MGEKVVKGACLVMGAVAGLFGEWPAALTILLVMMGVDYLTGVLVAATGRSPKTEGGGLSSKVGFMGLARKGFIMLIVLVATLLDRAVGNSAMVFQTATVCWYIANEGLSVLENADMMGVPFPGFVRERLERMREEQPEA